MYIEALREGQEQLKFVVDHQSAAKIWVNHWGFYDSLSKIYDSQSPKTLLGVGVWCTGVVQNGVKRRVGRC